MNKSVAIGGALLIAAAAYAYGWYRGDAGKEPDLVPAATAEEEPRKTLALSVVSIGFAIYLFASTGNGMGAMVPLVVGVIALLVVYDTWRQLEK